MRLAVAAALALLAITPAHALDAAGKAEADRMKELCKGDWIRHCALVAPGGGRGLACLEAHAAELSQPCRDALPAAKALREKAAKERAGG